MRLRIPSKRIRERFITTYELKGAQKAVDFLSEYYNVKRMRVVLDGKRVGARKANGWLACYSENKAFFTKRGLNRRTVLHEFYHYLADSKGLKKPEKIEEKNANHYAREFLRVNIK